LENEEANRCVVGDDYKGIRLTYLQTYLTEVSRLSVRLLEE
jgi:hypothetical protein